MIEKYICIHGHFYQPPRENPWLEEIELQESAEPYHDWNERITAECYNPNGVSRILNGEGKIIDIVNNYAKISFNFGPTLLSWMKEYAPSSYQYIIEGDRESIRNFNGHGSAMAQVYNHIIMPLANRRDKETQVIWGIADFREHFHREPEGMWLAETAVDLETLEVLVDHNIKFSVLAPNQAIRFREIGTEVWHNGIDPKRPYICQLPSGRSIVLFFYDGGLSQAIAFKGLLKDGKQFANHLLGAFNANDNTPQLVHVATDGESYGHHHRYGDMALAYCLRYIEENNLARIVNYSEYLSLFEPQYEVEIYENSSWSCAHGVERWRSNCGCSTGGRPDWNQIWRDPLRKALDWLRDQLAEIYQDEMELFNPDPWDLRNKYIDIILNREPYNVDHFLKEHVKTELSDHGKTQFMRLLEMQRYALLMFTSCAWFFDEISGIETVQVLQYANRAIQLGERVSNQPLENEFIQRLKDAKSNLPEHYNGLEIYDKYTSPARLTLTKVGMHYAVASLFADQPEKMNVLNYNVDNEFFERMEAGIQKLVIGRTTVYSNITFSRKYFSFVVIYLGQHQIIGSSSNQLSSKNFASMAARVKDSFNKSNVADVLQTMKQYFPGDNFSIWDLFKDERIKVINEILAKSLDEAKSAYEAIFDRNYNLINVMRSANMQIPAIFKQNLDIVINNDIQEFFQSNSWDTSRLKNLVQEVEKWQVPLNYAKISHVAEKKLYDLISSYYEDNTRIHLIHQMNEILDCLSILGIQPDLNEIQNLVFKISRKLMPYWGSISARFEKFSEMLNAFKKLSLLINLEPEIEGLSVSKVK
ncbi:MAG: DUF3536 domain-containing protein [Microscillaceae bacterium]|nr:DUF3536 domain-containing protein [Microscillaceae bacterium]